MLRHVESPCGPAGHSSQLNNVESSIRRNHGLTQGTVTQAQGAAQSFANSAFSSALSRLDRSNDGRLDSRDLPPGLRDRLLERMDQNGDGVIDAVDLAPLLQAKLDANDDGRIDLHDLGMDDAAIDRLRVLNVTHFGDVNNDGIINSADLPAILSTAGTVTLASLPPSLRAALMEALDSDQDGTLNPQDTQPILDALRSTSTGAAILGSLGDGHGHYSTEQLLLAYTSLQHLRDIRPSADGSVDLSSLPVSLQQALLSDIDIDRAHRTPPPSSLPLPSRTPRPASTNTMLPGHAPQTMARSRKGISTHSSTRSRTPPPDARSTSNCCGVPPAVPTGVEHTRAVTTASALHHSLGDEAIVSRLPLLPSSCTLSS